MNLQAIPAPDSPLFAELWRIYATAIAANERKPRWMIEAMCAREEYRLLTLGDAQRASAFAIVYLSRESDCALLEYMAVDACERNQGLGAQMLQGAFAAANAERERTLLLEVDSPCEQCEDRELRTRRQKFYLRNGCRRVEGLHYLLPAWLPITPPMMDLLLLRNDVAAPAKEDLRRWLKDVYVNVYGTNGEDARIEMMLEGVAQTASLMDKPPTF